MLLYVFLETKLPKFKICIEVDFVRSSNLVDKKINQIHTSLNLNRSTFTRVMNSAQQIVKLHIEILTFLLVHHT